LPAVAYAQERVFPVPVRFVPFPHSIAYWVAAFGATAAHVITAVPPAVTDAADTVADWQEVLDTTVVG
jgi:hypothetical protein